VNVAFWFRRRYWPVAPTSPEAGGAPGAEDANILETAQDLGCPTVIGGSRISKEE
jgi:hypothetical protein